MPKLEKMLKLRQPGQHDRSRHSFLVLSLAENNVDITQREIFVALDGSLVGVNFCPRVMVGRDF
jgi:hypothetical protein